MLGVRYYMATSTDAIPARINPDLTEVATSGPWVVYEVADSDLVTLARQPAGGARRRRRRLTTGWMNRWKIWPITNPGTSFFHHPAR